MHEELLQNIIIESVCHLSGNRPWGTLGPPPAQNRVTYGIGVGSSELCAVGFENLQ